MVNTTYVSSDDSEIHILPTKHVPVEDTLLYSGAIILKELSNPMSVSELWDIAKEYDSISTFERFVATLDMLHILGLVDLKDSKLIKVIR